jgi:hypothetical protein
VYDPVGGVLYKYMSFDTAMTVIQNGTVKYGSADQFNDPFEILGDWLDFTFTPAEMKCFLEKNFSGTREARENCWKIIKRPDNHPDGAIL